jgi:hypothetical protein
MRTDHLKWLPFAPSPCLALAAGALACANIFLFIGCGGFSLSPELERYRPDYQPELSIFGLISPDERFEFVIVERTLQIYEEKHTTANIIKEAKVSLISAADTVAFTFYQNESCNTCSFYYRYGIYLDQNHAFRAQPGETYNLVVETPDGRRAAGTARMPLVPQITAPAPDARLLKSSLLSTRVVWQDDPETTAYQLAFLIKPKSAKDRFDVFTEDDIFIVPPATFEKIDGYFLFNLDNYDKVATIKVMAMDRNYYDYLRSNTDLAEFFGQSLNLLEGAVGVFGAVNFDSVNVFLE